MYHKKEPPPPTNSRLCQKRHNNLQDTNTTPTDYETTRTTTQSQRKLATLGRPQTINTHQCNLKNRWGQETRKKLKTLNERNLRPILHNSRRLQNIKSYCGGHQKRNNPKTVTQNQTKGTGPRTRHALQTQVTDDIKNQNIKTGRKQPATK